MNHRFRNWWRQSKPKWWKGPSSQKPEPTPRAPAMKVTASVVEFFRGKNRKNTHTAPYHLPTYAPGVLPSGATTMAMDEAPDGVGQVFRYANGLALNEGLAFIGYAALAELTQRPEYRLPSEVMAEEMTRKWIVVKAKGDGDKAKRIEELTEALKVFKLREVFRDATEIDGFMGLSFIHIDLGTSDDAAEMATRLILDKAKIAKGSLKGFTVIDPLWCAPTTYNSSNPLKPDFYKPQMWFVMGMEVHVTRLLPIVSRPVPDILKPAYNFGGMSLSQMLMPYVRNWIRTRQSVSDLLNAFTVFVLETNMQAVLQDGGPAELDHRLELFATIRDNLGLMAVDKEGEALSNVSAPLGTLDKLQAQTQEHMAAVAREPFTKLFGITPTGLNATTDGEERSFYDTIHGRQERLYTDPLTICLKVIQLHLWGEIDPDLYFEYLPLWELDEAGKAAVEKTKADTDAVLIADGTISNEESRERLSRDHASPYHGLTGPAPEMPEAAPPDLEDPTEQIDKQAESGSESGANSGV